MIDKMDDGEKKKLAYKWCTQAYSTGGGKGSLKATKGDGGNSSAAVRCVRSCIIPPTRPPSHTGRPSPHSPPPRRKRGVAIFGENVTPKAVTIRQNSGDKKAGKSPVKRGRPKSVPEEITREIVKYESVLRSFKIPVYKTSVIAHLQLLVDGTPLKAKFVDAKGEWSTHKLDHWYIRRFLNDNDDVRTGAQRAMDIHREHWCTSAAVKPFYDDSKAALLEVRECIC